MAEFCSRYSFSGCLVLNISKVSATYSPWGLHKSIFDSAPLLILAVPTVHVLPYIIKSNLGSGGATEAYPAP